MYSFSDPVSILLSSQVSVEDDGFASLALKSRPVSINFRVNYQTNVSANEYPSRALLNIYEALTKNIYLQVSTQYQCTFWDFKNS